MALISRFKIITGLLVYLTLSTVYASDAEDRYRQASHPATAPEILKQLSFDKEPSIRGRVASNRKTPGDVLLSLAQDPASSVKIALATNLSAPEDIYLLLSRDEALSVRSVVARFEYVPVAALEILAKDKNVDIRLQVTRNLNSTKSILTQLLADSDTSVHEGAEQALQRLQDER
jgi:hypothetical protein